MDDLIEDSTMTPVPLGRHLKWWAGLLVFSFLGFSLGTLV